MRALITGGAGFIGSHIAALLARRAEVRVLDDLSTGRSANLAGLPVELVVGSILDRPLLREVIEDIDVVFHLAACISVPGSFAEPERYLEVNTRGTLVVLEEAARAGCQRFCLSSSAALYGDTEHSPVHEALPAAPMSPYAISKLAGEQFCAVFQRSGRLSTVSLRYFNVYGPRQRADSGYAAVVPAFLDRAARGQPLTIHGDGAQTRDFIYVDDVAAANVRCALDPALHGPVNVATGVGVSIRDLAAQVLRLSDSAGGIEHTAARPADIRHSVASTARLAATGWAPQWDLERGLKATIEATSLTSQGAGI